MEITQSFFKNIYSSQLNEDPEYQRPVKQVLNVGSEAIPDIDEEDLHWMA